MYGIAALYQERGQENVKIDAIGGIQGSQDVKAIEIKLLSIHCR